MRYDPHDKVYTQHNRYCYDLASVTNTVEEEEEANQSWFTHHTKCNNRIQMTHGQYNLQGSVFENNMSDSEMSGTEIGQWKQLVYTCIMLFIVLMVYFLCARFYPIEMTPIDQMVDAATRLFPESSDAGCMNRDMNNALNVPLQTPLSSQNSDSNHNNSDSNHINTTTTGNILSNQTGCAHTVPWDSEHVVMGSVLDRPDIKSFLFDLGGTSCACKLQWDPHQYWQRLIYGVKYVQPHVFTAFLGVLMSHRWQWVLLYKFLNEILEELALPVFGNWAMVDEFSDVEPRYDSLINDCLLSAIPFTALACHLVYALDLPDPLPRTLEYDIPTAKNLLVIFSQYYLLNNVNNFFDKFANKRYHLSWIGLTADLGKTCTFFLQIGTFAVIWWMKKWPWSKFFYTAICLLLIWIPFILYSIHTTANEQIAAMLSLALAGFITCYYQIRNTHKTCNLYILVWCVCWYVASFTLYCQLIWSAHPWILPPVDTFRYQRGSCGMNSGSEPQYVNTCESVL